jgi:hypothetical protein
MLADNVKPLQHPSKVPLIVIRSDFIGICVDSPSAPCAGALLGIFEYWTTHVRKLGPSKNQMPWVYKSQQSLKDDVMGLFGLNTIHKNLQWLVDQGYLKRRRNPKNRWDKTWQYQLAVEVIQPAIDQWCVENVDTLSVNDRDLETDVSTGQIELIEGGESKGAIQESSLESRKGVQRPAPTTAFSTPVHTKQRKERKSLDMKSKKVIVPQPHTVIDDDLRQAVAGLCYPNLKAEEVLADGDEARAIHQALKRIRLKTPTLLLANIFEEWGEWWQKHDFRGQRHQTPSPHQIVDTWMTFRNWRRGKAEQQQSLPIAVHCSGKHFDPITGTYVDLGRKSDGIVTRSAQ